MSEGNKGQNSSAEKKGGASKLIIAIGVVIIILLLVVIVILLLKKPAESVEESSASNTGREVAQSARMVVDEDSAANVMEEMRKEVEEGMFECNMSMTWTFTDGSAESKDAYVANSKNNKYPIYFDVTLNDTGETVYSSPVLPVGTELTNFALNKDLDAGTYKATVMYTLVRDTESQEAISSAGFVIKIVVNK